MGSVGGAMAIILYCLYCILLFVGIGALVVVIMSFVKDMQREKKGE